MEQLGGISIICGGAIGLIAFALYVAVYSKLGNILELEKP